MATSARRLKFANPDLTSSEVTYLTADYTTGTTLTVAYNAVFANDDFVVIGLMGNEKTEAIDVTNTVGATDVSISANLQFPHQSGTPVYRSEYNRIEISGDSGSGWSVLSTIDIQWDKTKTIYVHQGGTNADSYRFRFYNSASGNYSEYSPTITGAGFNKTQLGYRIDKIRKEINDPEGQMISTDKLIDLYDEAKDIVKGMRNDWWFWRKTDNGTITTTAATRQYDLDTISTKIEYVKDVRYRDASTANVELYPLSYKGTLEFDDLVKDVTNPEEDDSLTCYTIDPPDDNSTSGYLSVYPLPETTNAGSFYIRYYEPDDTYNDVSDVITIPQPSILDHYVLSYCYNLRGELDRSRQERSLFYGPTNFRKRTEQPTGIALLERIQGNKFEPTSKPKVLKRFRGRNYYQNTQGNSRSSSAWDAHKEKYF